MLKIFILFELSRSAFAAEIGMKATLSDTSISFQETCENLLPNGFPSDWELKAEEIAAMTKATPLIPRYLHVLSQVIDILENAPDLFFASLGAYMAVPIPDDFPDAIASYKGVPWSEVKSYLPEEINDPYYHKRSVQLLNALRFPRPHPATLEPCFKQLTYLNTHLVFLDLLYRIKDPMPRSLNSLAEGEAHIKRFIVRRGMARLEPKNFFLHARGATDIAAQLAGEHFGISPEHLHFVKESFERFLLDQSIEPFRNPAIQKAITSLQRLIRNPSSTDQTRFARVLLLYTRAMLKFMNEKAHAAGLKADDILDPSLNYFIPDDENWRFQMLGLICELSTGGVSYSSSQLRSQLKTHLKEMIKEFKVRYRVHKEAPQPATGSLFLSPAIENLTSIFKPEVQQGLSYRIARPDPLATGLDEEESQKEPVRLLGSLDDLQPDLSYHVLFDRIFHSQQVSFSAEVIRRLRQERQTSLPQASRLLAAIQAGPAREKGQKGIKRIEPPLFGKYDYEVKLPESSMRLLGSRLNNGVLHFEKFEDPH